MLKKVRIQNFKSIADETIELGRINVFIGENGCGKSNLLEAFAYLAGAMSNRLTVSDMKLRGVRVAKPEFTKSAFEKEELLRFEIDINIGDYSIPFEFFSERESNSINPYHFIASISMGPNRFLSPLILDDTKHVSYLREKVISQKEYESKNNDIIQYNTIEMEIVSKIEQIIPIRDHAKGYLIYQFETSTLRGFGSEYFDLLGIKGEGLDELFNNLTEDDRALVLEKMAMIGWLADKGILIDTDNRLMAESSKLGGGNSKLYFEDQYMAKGRNILSSENVNEGVLHLLACITAVVSSYTPRFFAIDNVDATLNPRLCRALTKTLADLVVEKDKQLLLTTQNPAILDGLDIYDEDQRLFAVSRDSEGKTRVRRIKIKEGVIFNENDPEGDVNGKKKTAKLSEMWMNGLLGAVPKFQM